MSELIDREALLDECLNHYEVGNIEQNCTMDWICKTVRNFPAASPWHRVEEGLPRGQELVIVAIKDTAGDTPFWYTQCGWITTDGEYWIVDNEICDYVVAWMPLPEPPPEVQVLAKTDAAPLWDSSTVYQPGDKVMYNGKEIIIGKEIAI